MELAIEPFPDGRDFFAVDGEGSTYLGFALTGQRPNWRSMLRTLGSDWA